MSEGRESIVLLAVSERAKESCEIRRNHAGWYACNVALSEREFQVLDQYDFIPWGSGAIVLASKGRSNAGVGEAHLWWVDPVCPRCEANGILRQLDAGRWEIRCPGDLETSQSDLWHVAMEWVALQQRGQFHGHRRAFPYDVT